MIPHFPVTEKAFIFSRFKESTNYSEIIVQEQMQHKQFRSVCLMIVTGIG